MFSAVEYLCHSVLKCPTHHLICQILLHFHEVTGLEMYLFIYLFIYLLNVYTKQQQQQQQNINGVFFFTLIYNNQIILRNV